VPLPKRSGIQQLGDRDLASIHHRSGGCGVTPPCSSLVVVLEEQTLRTRIGDADVMLGQLNRLLAVMSLPRVSVGTIPAGGLRHALAQRKLLDL